ncbi:venom serine protease 34-like [Phlebotomus argentipes]|uniref:venom serine protease 34-like n=1 Tax=Phlebotomus argentipes TaxID=94469 RepID=UPI0028930F4C|nr:venom serine protease 34-like [Phlebotomus argentipes]
MWNILGVFGIFLMLPVLGQNCYYDWTVPATSRPLGMPNTPYISYNAGQSCTWIARANTGNIIQLTCNVIIAGGLMPVCPIDYYVVSPTGQTDFSDGRKYCGQQSFVEHSKGNRMTMKLYSSKNSTGGLMSCFIKSVPDPCNCGRRNRPARIVGGSETGANEFPMVAALVERGDSKPYCGAVIISRSRALTVRHCVANRTTDSFDMVVGEHYVASNSESVYAKIYTISEYACVNGCEDRITKWDDVAMVKTTMEIFINYGVGITCLPWRDYKEDPNEYMNQKVEVAGWGFTQDNGQPSEVLQVVTLDVIYPEYCQKLYNNLTSNNMCTQTPRKGTCDGDSGGSVFWTAPDNNRLYTVALVDYGVDCALGWPGVNVRVAPNLQWILENAPESDFCIV